MKSRFFLSFGLASSLAAVSSHAAIIAQDSFDYSVGDLQGNGSGTDQGWSEGWRGNVEVDIEAPGLSYAGLTTTGNLANTPDRSTPHTGISIRL